MLLLTTDQGSMYWLTMQNVQIQIWWKEERNHHYQLSTYDWRQQEQASWLSKTCRVGKSWHVYLLVTICMSVLQLKVGHCGQPWEGPWVEMFYNSVKSFFFFLIFKQKHAKILIFFHTKIKNFIKYIGLTKKNQNKIKKNIGLKGWTTRYYLCCYFF